MKNFPAIALSVVLLLTVLTSPSISYANGWEDGFPLHVVYEEQEGSHYGEVSVTLTMVLPAGTPLLARDVAVSSFLSALQDIWNIESVHEDVRGFLGPAVPVDVQNTVSHISGTNFVLQLMDAFETVSDAGFSRFQTDTEIKDTENITVQRRSSPEGDYPDAPRFFAWVVGEGWPEDEENRENWVVAALINYSASVLSFRSEFGRFPSSLAEVMEKGHMLMQPINPYTADSVSVVDSVSRGDISYDYVDDDNVILMAYLKVGMSTEVIRREINIPSNGSYDLLYRESAGLSDTDMQVARYIFQLAQILNEYYYQFNDLPYRIPQIEAEGFAYVSFLNPYTNMDVQAANNFSPQGGNYYYQRISSSEYLLIGYGEDGQSILTLSNPSNSPQLETGAMHSQ